MKGSFKTALVAAVVSAVVSASAAVATTSNFILGSTNRVDAPSTVVNVKSNGTTNPVDAPLLTLDNRSATANATPLSLIAAPGHSPFKVNTQAKVANLNADKLDGIDSTSFLARGINVVGSISIGSIAPLTCADLLMTAGGAQVGQVPFIGFQGSVSLPSALVLMALAVPSAGHVTARVCNPTATASVATSDIGVRIITLK
jgi:hypothetical protein